MRRRSLLPRLAVLALGPAWALQAQAEKFDPTRDASADVQQALQLAQAQRKLVLVDVGGEWCTWCHVFDRFVLARPQVRQTLQERYLLVKVNYSPQNRNQRLLAAWPKAQGYPHFYVLDAKGHVLESQASGELEDRNDSDEAKVLAFLRRNRPAQ